MSNYVASGWKQDLMHLIGCCWAAQVGPLDNEEWEVAIRKFLVVMRNRKAIEWTDIKELTPLKFMPYVANLFWEVTGKDLQGLGQFTGWIGLGDYYHWKVAQQGLLHTIPHLQGWPVPQGPIPHPSGRPHPRVHPGPRLRQLEPLRGDRTEPNQPQIEVEKDPPLARVENLPPPARVGNHPPQVQVESLPPPARAVNWPPQAEVRNQLPQEALSTCPRKGKERATVPGPTGTKGPCMERKVGPLSSKGLPI